MNIAMPIPTIKENRLFFVCSSVVIVSSLSLIMVSLLA